MVNGHCVLCKSNKSLQEYVVTIDTQYLIRGYSRATFNLCKDCRKYAVSDAVIAGMNEMRNKDMEPS